MIGAELGLSAGVLQSGQIVSSISRESHLIEILKPISKIDFEWVGGLGR